MLNCEPLCLTWSHCFRLGIVGCFDIFFCRKALRCRYDPKPPFVLVTCCFQVFLKPVDELLPWLGIPVTSGAKSTTVCRPPTFVFVATVCPLPGTELCLVTVPNMVGAEAEPTVVAFVVVLMLDWAVEGVENG